MQDNNLPEPEENEEEEKKKKGGLGWFAKNQGRAKWGSRVGNGGSGSIASGSRAAGAAGADAEVLVGGGRSVLGAGSKSGGFFSRLSRFFRGGATGSGSRSIGALGGAGGRGLGSAAMGGGARGGGLLARLLGRGGVIARFLGTRAGMAIAGLLVAALAVGAAMYYNSADTQTVNVASLPGDGFSPSGQSSAYPMPNESMLGDDSFLNDSVPTAGSLPQGDYPTGTVSTEYGTEPTTSESAPTGTGTSAYDMWGGGGGASTYIGTGGSVTPGTGTGGTGTGYDDPGTGGGGGTAGTPLNTGGLDRFRKSANMGRGATVGGAKAGRSSRAFTALRRRTYAQSTRATQQGDLESASFVASGAFDAQDDVVSIGDGEAGTGTFSIDPVDPEDPETIDTDISVPSIPVPTPAPVAPVSPELIEDPIAPELVADIKASSEALTSVLTDWQGILSGDGNAKAHYNAAITKLSTALSKALEAIDDVDKMLKSGSQTTNAVLDSGALISLEVVSRIGIISGYLSDYWLRNALAMAYPVERCSQSRIYKVDGSWAPAGQAAYICPDLTEYVLYTSQVCSCLRDWRSRMRTSQIRGGPKPGGWITVTPSVIPDGTDCTRGHRYPYSVYSPNGTKCDHDGCSLELAIGELDTAKIQQELKACDSSGLSPEARAALSASYLACLAAEEEADESTCLRRIYGSSDTLKCDKMFSSYVDESDQLRNDYLPHPQGQEYSSGWWAPTQCSSSRFTYATTTEAYFDYSYSSNKVSSTVNSGKSRLSTATQKVLKAADTAEAFNASYMMR